MKTKVVRFIVACLLIAVFMSQGCILVFADDIFYGDVDGNEQINVNDLILLRNYLAEYDYDTGISTVEVASGADVNGNGEIALTDSILLSKYLANYDYDTGISDVILGPQGGDSYEEPEVTIDPITGENYQNLEGYRYNAYVRSRGSGNGAFYCEDFWVETTSPDALSYAVYERNQTIENDYNCRIRQFDSAGEQYDEMTRFYYADERYELAILLAASAAQCSAVGLLQDIFSLETIDLSREAFDQNSIQSLPIYGHLYYLSGDMNISTMDTAAITIFNPDLFGKYNFVEECGNEAYDDLYEMVLEGTWTVSSLMEMAEVVNIDAAADGGTLVAADGDQVGYLEYSATPMYYWYGCGARISETDDDGNLSLVFGVDGIHSAAIFDFLYTQLNNQQAGKEWIPNGGGGMRNSEFMTDALLFTDIIIWDVRKVLHPQDKARYGILPIPKYDEEQEDYHDIVYWPYSTTHLWSIPTQCNDLDKASYLFQVLAEYSAAPGGTMDAYYIKTLELSVAHDAGSRATMEIVHDSVTYDIFLLYNWGNFIQRLIEGLDTAASNQYGDLTTPGNIESAIADMELTLERFKNPIDPLQE